MNSKILNIKREYDSDVQKITSKQDALIIRKKFLSREGKVNELLRKGIDIISEQERKEFLKDVNSFKIETSKDIKLRIKYLQESEFDEKIEKETVDIYETRENTYIGKESILSIVINDIKNIFIGMGYTVTSSKDILKREIFNKQILEDRIVSYIKSNSIYLDEEKKYILNSFPEVNLLEEGDVNIKKISIQTVYKLGKSSVKSDRILTGMYIAKNLKLSNAIDIARTFLREYFASIRYQIDISSDNPFEELMLDIKIMCNSCIAKGCDKCAGTGFITIGKIGIINSSILNNFNLNINEKVGIYFELDTEKIAMYKCKLESAKDVYERNIKII